jgi:hypothetical protein
MLSLNQLEDFSNFNAESYASGTCSPLAAPTAAFAVTALFVALHVAAHAEPLAAALDLALVRLLARVGVGVDLEAAGAGEVLRARRADVAVLRWRKG